MWKQLKIFFVVATLLLLFLTPATTQEFMPKKNVLLLMSYHIGFGWHDDMLKGVQDAFENSSQNYELFVEFFDTVRFPVAEVKEHMDFIMEEKYKDRQIDVIIVADDYGLQNLIDTKMYEKAPVVFVGVNHLPRVDEARQLGMTGVIETVEFKRTVELILQVHPDVKRIVPVIGNSRSGRNHEKNLATEFHQIETDVKLDFLPNDWTFSSLAEKLHAYDPSTTVIIQASFHRDFEDNLAGSIGNYSFFYQFDIPAYTLWITSGIGSGMLGGIVSDGKVHGRVAAEKAIAILKGVDPLDITVDSGAQINYPVFDYELMRKFDVLNHRVPDNSTIVNIPVTFYQEYNGLIWSGAGFVLVQMVLGSFMLMHLREKHRLDKRATKQAKELMDVRHELERREILGITKTRIVDEECPNVDDVFSTLSTVLGRINKE